MKEDLSLKFQIWKVSSALEGGPEHKENCRYHGRNSIPVSECMCDCYEEAIFRAGYEAAKVEAS